MRVRFIYFIGIAAAVAFALCVPFDFYYTSADGTLYHVNVFWVHEFPPLWTIPLFGGVGYLNYWVIKEAIKLGCL